MGMVDSISIDFGPVMRAIDRMGSEITSEVHVEVGKVRSDLKLTNDELKDLRREFDKYVIKAEQTANIQRSETKIGTLKDDLDRDFGHYAVVRRTSVGTLQAFDVGNVGNETVTAISEELMVQSPRYWLAPALVGLACWSRDDAEIAEKSINEAFSRDPQKTSLFFSLVLRRQGRTAGATRWLRHYLSSLDPSKLTREFAVVLEASALDAFGPEGESLVSTQIAEWNALLREREGVVEEQVARWTEEISVSRKVLDESFYANLKELSPDWPVVRSQLEAASALPEVHDKYVSIKATPASSRTQVLDLLDDLLEQLVTEYDAEELPLRREIAYHQAVIDESGDLDRARARADMEQRALEETVDAVSLQTTAAIMPDALGVSTQTQKIAIGTGRADFRSAVGRYAADYRSRAVDAVKVELGEDHSNFARTFGFPGWTAHTSTKEDAVLSSLDDAWNATFKSYIERVTFKNKWYILPSAIAVVVVVIAFLINWVAGIVLLLLGGAAVYFLGERAKKSALEALENAEGSRDEARDVSRDRYRDTVAEFVDARETYEELDKSETPLLTLVKTWPVGTAIAKESK